jgi:hypothetical protein
VKERSDLESFTKGVLLRLKRARKDLERYSEKREALRVSIGKYENALEVLESIRNELPSDIVKLST